MKINKNWPVLETWFFFPINNLDFHVAPIYAAYSEIYGTLFYKDSPMNSLSWN